jgi:predicted dehydrogenase
MPPLRLGIAGLSHDHVFWLLRNLSRTDVELAGIYEPDAALSERYAARFGFSRDITFTDLGTMLDSIKPEAVAAFGSIYDHLTVVEACAPRGIHVMVEKPLAVSLEHATRMKLLAEQYNIHLLTNFETTWYASTERTYQMVHEEGAIGDIRKVVVHDGHYGPKELGCTPDFLNWLTDPILNGGGAIIDFGCYGANLMTWLMGGERPTSVTASTRQFKPDIYPRVDDDATLILNYPRAQAIIQASWNWPFNRKDMEVYGQSGYIIAVNDRTMRVRLAGDNAEQLITLDERTSPERDPFTYLAAIVQGTTELIDGNLWSLSNNRVVVEILDAARASARTGQTITL